MFARTSGLEPAFPPSPVPGVRANVFLTFSSCSYLFLSQTRQRMNENAYQKERKWGKTPSLCWCQPAPPGPREEYGKQDPWCTIACAKTCQLIKLTDTQLFVHRVIKVTFCTGNNTTWKREVTCLSRLNPAVRRPRLRLSNTPL